MPGDMDGFQLAKHIVEFYPGVKVLLASGYPDKIGKREIYKQEYILLLAKPYIHEALMDAIDMVLQT